MGVIELSTSRLLVMLPGYFWQVSVHSLLLSVMPFIKAEAIFSANACLLCA
jgi:hypothetical protein